MSGGPAIVADDVQARASAASGSMANAPLPLSAGIVLDNSAVEIDDMEIEGAGIGSRDSRGGQPVAGRECDSRLPGGGRADLGRLDALALA